MTLGHFVRVAASSIQFLPVPVSNGHHRLASLVVKRTFASSSIMANCVREIEGDLFSAPKDHSLAHCVAADLKMGAGIAVRFKQLYGKVDELKAQNVGVGGVAVLADGPQRYVYYLITKKTYNLKPTYDDLTKSLHAMKEHMSANGVGKLAIPRIGCGIDGLEWDKVKDILNNVFGENGAYEIVVYNFVPK
ncbi:ADP-ribose glycohydrolase OARD1-like [Anopheles maculipalpis]|uniref:ADP-ribose glycohydrolase OARD1-like n=1 Tax=Anopheles maculipalpis TaxID=1496333 RepID=UPI0021595BAE|nr:ADP-ribose glycohydrolase OARD1-like [Anopheles maculipalpis]